MLPAHILNPEIISYQRERDRAGKMLPQAWCMFTLVISLLGEGLIRRVAFWDIHIRFLQTCPNCIVPSSRMGREKAASSCIRNDRGGQSSKNSWCRGTCTSCLLCWGHCSTLVLMWWGRLFLSWVCWGSWLFCHPPWSVCCGSIICGWKLTTTLAYMIVRSAGMRRISAWVIPKIVLVPFCPILLSPCAMAPKYFPKAVCHISIVAGLFINFL